MAARRPQREDRRRRRVFLGTKLETTTDYEPEPELQPRRDRKPEHQRISLPNFVSGPKIQVVENCYLIADEQNQHF